MAHYFCAHYLSVVGPQHAISKLACLVLSSARSCRSSICLGRLSTAWLISLVVFEAVNMPCPGPFHFSYSVDYIYDFCPLPDPDVGLSIFICDVEHTAFHFGLCCRKFVLCLFGQCPGLHHYVTTGYAIFCDVIGRLGVWLTLTFCNPILTVRP